MILWHFLTRSRLTEKLEYAQSNNGELLLHPPELSKDLTKGKLTRYIYCLPSICSGMNFGGDDAGLCLLQIRLKESAKGYKFRGDPRHLDYQDLTGGFDFIDMVVDASEFSNIRFRQLLLLNSSAVKSWHHSLQIDFRTDFEVEHEKIKSRQFQRDNFFMIDFTLEEIQAAVDLNAHLLGFQNLTPSVLEINRSKIESALSRLGAI
jgi:hypothetical protein